MGRTSQIQREKALQNPYSDDKLSAQCKAGRFPSPFRDPRLGLGDKSFGRDKPRAIMEIRMYALSHAMREKKDWQQKRLDLAITAKWKEEIQVQEESVPLEHRLSEDMVSELGAANNVRTLC